MKPKYFQVFLEYRTGPPRMERSRGGGSKPPCDLEKWNTFIFECFIIRPKFFSKLEIML